MIPDLPDWAWGTYFTFGAVMVLFNTIVLISSVIMSNSHSYGYNDATRRRDARIALKCLALYLAIIAWPVAMWGASYVGIRSLWRKAELPTLAEKRAERRASREAQLEREKQFLKDTIARLEREELGKS
jgi:hypothetical protein